MTDLHLRLDLLWSSVERRLAAQLIAIVSRICHVHLAWHSFPLLKNLIQFKVSHQETWWPSQIGRRFWILNWLPGQRTGMSHYTMFPARKQACGRLRQFFKSCRTSPSFVAACHFLGAKCIILRSILNRLRGDQTILSQTHQLCLRTYYVIVHNEASMINPYISKPFASLLYRASRCRNPITDTLLTSRLPSFSLEK